MVVDLVEGRNIDPGDGGQATKQVGAVRFLGDEGFEQGGEDDLPFADGEEIHDPGQRFGVEKGADAAAENQGMALLSLGGKEGDAPELEDGRQVEIIVFKGDRKGDDVKVGKKPSRLEREEGVTGLSVLGEVLGIGEKKTLAECVVPEVDQMVDGEEAEVAHGLVVGVGIDQGDPEVPPPGFGPSAAFGLQARPRLVGKFS
jgi:hypothetical protein